LTVATTATSEAPEVGTVAKVATVTVANAEIEKVIINDVPSDDLFFADDRRHCGAVVT